MFDQGDRVITTSGPGTVVYRMMEPPDFINVIAYSVKVDNISRQGYTGTIFPANDVSVCEHEDQYVSDRSTSICRDCGEELGR